MRALAFLLVLSLSSSLPGQIAGKAATLDPMDPGFNSGTEGKIKIFHIGPYTIPAGRMIGTVMVPGEFEQTIRAPDAGDVFMTGFDSRIVDQNRVPVDPAEVYLHHAMMMKAGARDLTCPIAPGERFTTAGDERIPFTLPPGYGYRILASDAVWCNLHMQNFTTSPKTVYYQYSMTVLPGNIQPPLLNARPWLLDVRPCTSTYIVPKGTGPHETERDYPVPGNLRILKMGPHLHCGGVKLDLINKTTNTLIHSFPNRRPCPVDLVGVMPTPPLLLNQNTMVTLRATYQKDPNADLSAMGILLCFVY